MINLDNDIHSSLINELQGRLINFEYLFRGHKLWGFIMTKFYFSGDQNGVSDIIDSWTDLYIEDYNGIRALFFGDEQHE